MLTPLTLAGLPVYPDARPCPGELSRILRWDDGRASSCHVTPEVWAILKGECDG